MRAIVLSFGLLLIAGKLLMAWRLGLFGDEAFYWQCGQRPSLCYVDHPPVTAMLVRAGVSVLGHQPLGVRVGFWLLGALLPLVVFHLARPIVGRRDAWWAAGASLVLPPIAHAGSLAVPDAVLLVVSALYLLAVERATRLRALGWWCALGAVGALGLATHYRFALFPLAALAWGLATRAGRAHWRTAGPWLALVLTLPGLAPAIAYNQRVEMASVGYYLAGRHDLEFSARALGEFLAIQILFVTPLLAVALVGAFRGLLDRARGGDDRAGMLLTFATVPIATYVFASPFESSGLVTAHWPAHAYLPLLLCLPGTVRAFVERRPGPWRRTLAALTPALPGVAVLVILLEMSTGWLEIADLRDGFIGGSEVSAYVADEHLGRVAGADGRAVVIAGDYKLAAKLELGLRGRADVYVLEDEVERLHGRSRQLAEWGRDAAGLASRAGQDALFVIALPHEVHQEQRVEQGRRFVDGLRPCGYFAVRRPGRRRDRSWRFEVYEGVVAAPTVSAADGVD